MTQLAIHILGELRPSGMERMLEAAATELRRNGYDTVVVGVGAAHPFREALESAGCAVYTIRSSSRIRQYAELSQLLRRLHPGLVHLHTESQYGVLAPLLRLSASAPVVRTIHNVFRPTSRRDRVSRRVQAVVGDWFVSALIAPSPDVVENEESIRRSCFMILNWVSDRFFSRTSSADRGLAEPVDGRARRTAVVVGNCSPIKNHELALEALLGTDYSVVHLGLERDISAAEKLILDKLEANGQMHYRGVADPAEYLPGAHVFLMPSRAEGMGIALAEALVCQVPSLVADVVGLRWARGLPGVGMLGASVAEWRAALLAPPAVGHDRVVVQAFSVRRGARELAAVYDAVTHAAGFDGLTRAKDAGDGL